MSPLDPEGASALVSFVDATAMWPDPDGPAGRYRADLQGTWNSPFGLHGGVFAGTVTRAAAQAHGDDGLTVRSIHGRYLERPANGNLIVDTTVLRKGGVTAFVEADAHSEGQEPLALRLGALFTRVKEAGAFLDATAPDVPAPDDCEESGILPTSAAAQFPTGGPTEPPPLFRNLEIRSAVGVMPWEPGWRPEQSARYVRWGRFRVRPELPDGGLDPLAMLVFADLPAPALWVRLRPEDPFHTIVSLELTFHVLERPSDEWLLVDTRARWMGDGYLFTETDVWSAGRLCASSSQMMLVRVLVPPASE